MYDANRDDADFGRLEMMQFGFDLSGLRLRKPLRTFAASLFLLTASTGSCTTPDSGKFEPQNQSAGSTTGKDEENTPDLIQPSIPVLRPPPGPFSGQIPSALTTGAEIDVHPLRERPLDGWQLQSEARAVSGSRAGEPPSESPLGFLIFKRDETSDMLLVLTSGQPVVGAKDVVLHAAIIEVGPYDTVFDGELECRIGASDGYLVLRNEETGGARLIRARNNRISILNVRKFPPDRCKTEAEGD